MTESSPSRRRVPPWQVLLPVVLLAILTLFAATFVVIGLVSGEFAGVALLAGLPIAAVLGLIVVGLWQRRRGARFAGFLVGLAVMVYGLYIYGEGSPGLEMPVGLAIAIPLATRTAAKWVRPE